MLTDVSDTLLLYDLLRDAQQYPVSVPVHVIGRLQAFVSDREVLLTDVALQRSDDGVTGRICLFTPDVVIVADLTDSPSDRNDLEGRTVALSCWARRSLQQIALAEGEGVNEDTVWKEWPAAFPRWRGQLALTYEAGVVLLPGSPRETSGTHYLALTALLPRLLDDL